MKLSYLALKFFKQHWLANILIILEMIFTLFTGTILINRTSYIFQTYQAFENTPLEHSIYFMGHVGAVTDSGVVIKPYMDDLQASLSELHGIKSISSIGLFNTTDNDMVIAYDDVTASFLKQDTTGDWLTQDRNDGVVVYRSNHEIGTSLTINIELYNQYSYDLGIKSEVRSGSFEVIGTCDTLSDTLLYTTLKTNKTVTLDSFLLNNSFYKDSTVYFIPADHEIFKDYTQSTDTLFLYLDETISKQDIDAIHTVLDTYGTHMDGSDMLELTYQDAINRLVYDMYSFLSIAVIALISLVSITFLNIKKFSSYISIYYLNGCSFRKAMYIYLLYLCSLLCSAILLFYILLLYINYDTIVNNDVLTTLYMRTYEIKFSTQCTSILLVVLMMIIESFIPFYFISRKSRITLLKETR